MIEIICAWPSKLKMDVRKVKTKVLSVEQAEGVGARVRRSIGRKEVRRLTK